MPRVLRWPVGMDGDTDKSAGLTRTFQSLSAEPSSIYCVLPGYFPRLLLCVLSASHFIWHISTFTKQAQVFFPPSQIRLARKLRACYFVMNKFSFSAIQLVSLAGQVIEWETRTELEYWSLGDPMPLPFCREPKKAQKDPRPKGRWLTKTKAVAVSVCYGGIFRVGWSVVHMCFCAVLSQ